MTGEFCLRVSGKVLSRLNLQKCECLATTRLSFLPMERVKALKDNGMDASLPPKLSVVGRRIKV